MGLVERIPRAVGSIGDNPFPIVALAVEVRWAFALGTPLTIGIRGRTALELCEAGLPPAWDSGNLKDDIFALYLDGSLLQLPATPVFPPITTEVALEPDRQYEVLLLGVSAPDQIGTYTISFSPEIEVLPGSDALSGNDLVANATKFFYIRVNSDSSAAPLQLEADPAVPVWFEPTTGAVVTAAGR